MKAAELRALAALAEARRGRDLGRLEALIAEARGLEEEIVGLSGTSRLDAAAGPVPFDQIGRRLAWAEAEIARRRRRLAGLAVEIAGVRAAARISVGKHEALNTLVVRATRDEAAARERRDEAATVGWDRRGEP
jgi:hypothetical protein